MREKVKSWSKPVVIYTVHHYISCIPDESDGLWDRLCRVFSKLIVKSIPAVNPTETITATSSCRPIVLKGCGCSGLLPIASGLVSQVLSNSVQAALLLDTVSGPYTHESD